MGVDKKFFLFYGDYLFRILVPYIITPKSYFTFLTAESNSQAIARTLLLSALHRITRISKQHIFGENMRSFTRGEAIARFNLIAFPVHPENDE